MAYSTNAAVRRKAGALSKVERGIGLKGTADGVNKTFYIPQAFLGDTNGDGSVTTADITVYDDGTSVAVTSIDIDINQVVLTAAPAAASVMTADYIWHTIKESEITTAIANADARIDRATGYKGSAANVYTQYWNGDGENRVFHFDHRPVTAINSYDIDGVTSGLTELTHYWLQPVPTRAFWIEFLSAPTTDHQNVKIVYQYGEVDTVVAQLSMYMAAVEILEDNLTMGNQATATYKGRQQGGYTRGSNKNVALIDIYTAKIDKLWSEVGGIMEVVIQ
jgi:hypothetical protein